MTDSQTVTEIMDTLKADMQYVTLDTGDFNKIHNSISMNKEKIAIMKQMMKTQSQSKTYEETITALKKYIDTQTLNEEQANELKKQIADTKLQRIRQRKVISKLYEEIHQYKKKNQQLTKKVTIMEKENKILTLRFENKQKSEREFKKKCHEYLDKLQVLEKGQESEETGCNNNADTVVSRRGSQLHKGFTNEEEQETVKILQAELKDKEQVMKKLKAVLVKYKKIIQTNGKSLHVLCNRIDELQKLKETQVQTEIRSIQTEPMARKSAKTQKQKRQLMKKWLKSINTNNSTTATATERDHDMHGLSLKEIIQDIKLQVQQRKLTQLFEQQFEL